ncbi:hypothetical protein EIP86_000475 [Pleurotus ostreatoroseus]|nr:hypothetical protein EIP86_000475 [Pleurotus ostreatoroseus]
MAQKNPEESLKTFVSEDPQSRYTFDSERGAPESEICREGDKLSRKCIKVNSNAFDEVIPNYAGMLFDMDFIESINFIQHQQDLGFFCALPMDPSRTYIECKPIPKA